MLTKVEHMLFLQKPVVLRSSDPRPVGSGPTRASLSCPLLGQPPRALLGVTSGLYLLLQNKQFCGHYFDTEYLQCSMLPSPFINDSPVTKAWQDRWLLIKAPHFIISWYFHVWHRSQAIYELGLDLFLS